MKPGSNILCPSVGSAKVAARRWFGLLCGAQLLCGCLATPSNNLDSSNNNGVRQDLTYFPMSYGKSSAFGSALHVTYDLSTDSFLLHISDQFSDYTDTRTMQKVDGGLYAHTLTNCTIRCEWETRYVRDVVFHPDIGLIAGLAGATSSFASLKEGPFLSDDWISNDRVHDIKGQAHYDGEIRFYVLRGPNDEISVEDIADAVQPNIGNVTLSVDFDSFDWNDKTCETCSGVATFPFGQLASDMPGRTSDLVVSMDQFTYSSDFLYSVLNFDPADLGLTSIDKMYVQARPFGSEASVIAGEFREAGWIDTIDPSDNSTISTAVPVYGYFVTDKVVP